MTKYLCFNKNAKDESIAALHMHYVLCFNSVPHQAFPQVIND